MRSNHGCLVLLTILGARRADRSRTTIPGRDASPHVRMMAIAPGMSLEMLDWGGNGRPLVLLAGLGNTAHVFDNFAPSLTDRFHVYGITRRGFGRSSQPPAGDVATLVSDLRTVLDSLHLSTAILVGHSIAGEELTAFALSHPNRCQALVYLDAAYDRSETTLLRRMQRMRWPRRPPMTAVDSASPASLEAYLARTGGVQIPEADVRATARFDSVGTYVGDLTSDSLALRMTRNLLPPAYQRLKCPSLAIYAVPDSAGALVPWYAELDSTGRADAERYLPMAQAWDSASRTQYRQNAPFSRVVEIHNANHYVFLSNRVETLSAIRTFLESTP